MFNLKTLPSQFFSATQEEKVEFFWWCISKKKGEARLKDHDINYYYKIGRDLSLISMDFLSFKNKVLKERGTRSGIIQGYWYIRHGTDFRKPLKYSKRPHIARKTKTLAEVSADDWRAYKGFKRDKAKPKRSSSRKKWAKLYSNKKYRAYTREQLQKENFEELTTLKNKSFFDPWDWD